MNLKIGETWITLDQAYNKWKKEYWWHQLDWFCHYIDHLKSKGYRIL